jgi:ABC-2 type transport system permease protein
MNFSMRRVNAIFLKDFKDISRNSAVSVTALMPLILAFIYGKIGADSMEMELHYMIINFSLVTIGTFVQCSLIAEEKEKNTLRGLMLSPASIIEILGGKSLLSFLSSMIVVFIGAYLTGYQPDNLLIIALSIILGSFFYIGLGTLLGLVAKSVMEASVIVLPFMGIFGFGSLFKMFADKYPIFNLIDYTPNMQLMEIAIKVESGLGFGEVWSNFAIIALWSILIFVLSFVAFKKRMTD